MNDRFNAFVTKNPYPSREEWIKSGFYGTDIYRAYLLHVQPQVGRNYDDPRLQDLQKRMSNNKGDSRTFLAYFNTAFINLENSISRTL